MEVELLDTSLKETLFKVLVKGCGITDLSAPHLEMNETARATAKMYSRGSSSSEFVRSLVQPSL